MGMSRSPLENIHTPKKNGKRLDMRHKNKEWSNQPKIGLKQRVSGGKIKSVSEATDR